MSTSHTQLVWEKINFSKFIFYIYHSRNEAAAYIEMHIDVVESQSPFEGTTNGYVNEMQVWVRQDLYSEQNL